ncbi:conserved hypothetical protein [Sphingomonas sp. EC-HK361]|uniref:DUF1801 domain-containing protein n=1 Tax=Sphingomonas sp. EC-HK361 TaxID=2038397 RepID=UPI001256E1ED|nr:DUF1801 domain-containing protein [Sphingomonas sp. EC-HK361]VVS96817.1 conserved hypothetical protein [Sphingomonas sp. EC-HK361]
MAASKTQPTAATVDGFLDSVEPPERRADARAIAAMLARVSGEPATMWGPAIVGFGRYRYRYDSGREGEMCRVGFSPRKAAFTFYLTTGFAMRQDLLDRLGKHSSGKGCLYVKALADIDQGVLEELVRASLADMAARHPD